MDLSISPHLSFLNSLPISHLPYMKYYVQMEFQVHMIFFSFPNYKTYVYKLPDFTSGLFFKMVPWYFHDSFICSLKYPCHGSLLNDLVLGNLGIYKTFALNI